MYYIFKFHHPNARYVFYYVDDKDLYLSISHGRPEAAVAQMAPLIFDTTKYPTHHFLMVNETKKWMHSLSVPDISSIYPLSSIRVINDFIQQAGPVQNLGVCTL